MLYKHFFEPKRYSVYHTLRKIFLQEWFILLQFCTRKSIKPKNTKNG